MTTSPEGVVGQVARYVHEETLWAPGERLLAAVSGGPDSVVLLDVLLALGLEVTVGHVNHRLRSEAAADAAFVRELAARRGAPFLLREVDVPARVTATGESVEEAARELRYAALREMAREAKAGCIATGHTADDQAETVLMRVLRGTGVAGLAGIPARRDEIVRPLLPIWRREILAYLSDHDLSCLHDLSNDSTAFTRNRIRLDLLPLLEREYAPRLRVRLARLAEIARQDTAALDGWAEREYARLRRVLPTGPALPVELPALPRAIVWRLWRLALAEVRGGLADIGYEHLEDIQRLSAHQEVHLPGVRVLHEARQLVFLPAGDAEPAEAIPETPLPAPGQVCLLDAGCCLTATVGDDAPPLAGGDTAVLDADALAGPLTLRAWRPGDRYQPFGAPGSRKLQDIFVDAGVPRRLRPRIPVIFDEQGIVWLAGFRIADRVKITASTQHFLRLYIEWELNPWILKRFDSA